jgi:hypothetical protein
MIELPTFAKAASFAAEFVDAGFTQRGLQSIDYIPRKGSRYKAAFSYGPYIADEGRVMVARLIRAKQEGMRVALPLIHSQGNPGATLLNGATASGRVLSIKSVTPGYVCKEGYWLNLVKGGQNYLHQVAVGGRASDAGILAITLNELLRTDFPNNAVVNIGKPVIEGIVEGDVASWNYSVDRVIPIEFAIEEKA